MERITKILDATVWTVAIFMTVLAYVASTSQLV